MPHSESRPHTQWRFYQAPLTTEADNPRCLRRRDIIFYFFNIGIHAEKLRVIDNCIIAKNTLYAVFDGGNSLYLGHWCVEQFYDFRVIRITLI